MAPQPKPAPKREALNVKKLHVVRHGNDDYSALELMISGDGIDWKTTGSKTLVAHVSRNVVSAEVERWHRDFAGKDFYGDTGL